jgi:hypothetical protein
MIHLKTNPKGIDLAIQKVQQRLYDKITTTYSCDVEGFGRVYVDVKDDFNAPYAYLSKGEYKEVLNNDTVNGIHFFFVEDDTSSIIERSSLSTSDIDLIVIVNDLTKVKGDVLHYQDEEIKEEVKEFLKGCFKINTITKGKKALDGFDVSKLQFIYPYFVFKISATINNY